MDPDAVLAEIREILDSNYGEEVSPLAEKVRDLDEWLSRGGFLPREWAKAPRRSGAVPQPREGGT